MPKRAHLVTLKAPGRKGTTGAQCAAWRLREISDGVLADGTLGEGTEGASIRTYYGTLPGRWHLPYYGHGAVAEDQSSALSWIEAPRRLRPI